MAQYTEKYRFKKPGEDEFYNVNDQNENWDKNEEALKAIDEKIDNSISEGMIKTASGTANALTIETSGKFSYTQGRKIAFKAIANNTSNVTLNIDSKGAKTLKKLDGTQVAANGLKNGKVYEAYFDVDSDCFFLLARAEGDAIAENVLATKVFSNGDDIGLVGTMPNRGSVGTQNLTTEGAEYTIQAGYHNGLGKIKAVITGLIASVIKAGTTVGGILGTFTADATAAAGDMLSGKTAYVNGAKVTGTIPTIVNGQSYGSASADGGANSPITTYASNADVGAFDFPINGYANNATIRLHIYNLLAPNIKAGVKIGRTDKDGAFVQGTFTSDANAVASVMQSGYAGYVNGVKVTGNLVKNPNVIANTNHIESLEVTIQNGISGDGKRRLYLRHGSTSKHIVDPDMWVTTPVPDLLAQNILAGKNILGIAGGIPNKSFAANGNSYAAAKSAKGDGSGTLCVEPFTGYYEQGLNQFGFGNIWLNDPSYKAENIRAGYSIFGIAGTFNKEYGAGDNISGTKLRTAKSLLLDKYIVNNVFSAEKITIGSTDGCLYVYIGGNRYAKYDANGLVWDKTNANLSDGLDNNIGIACVGSNIFILKSVGTNSKVHQFGIDGTYIKSVSIPYQLSHIRADNTHLYAAATYGNMAHIIKIPQSDISAYSYHAYSTVAGVKYVINVAVDPASNRLFVYYQNTSNGYAIATIDKSTMGSFTLRANAAWMPINCFLYCPGDDTLYWTESYSGYNLKATNTADWQTTTVIAGLGAYISIGVTSEYMYYGYDLGSTFIGVSAYSNRIGQFYKFQNGGDTADGNNMAGIAASPLHPNVAMSMYIYNSANTYLRRALLGYTII